MTCQKKKETGKTLEYLKLLPVHHITEDLRKAKIRMLWIPCITEFHTVQSCNEPLFRQPRRNLEEEFTDAGAVLRRTLVIEEAVGSRVVPRQLRTTHEREDSQKLPESFFNDLFHVASDSPKWRACGRASEESRSQTQKTK